MASLVADYGESSAESSEDSDAENIEEENIDEKTEPATNERLPPPAFTDKIKNSVFVNPFLEAENAKFAVLEKHVKMVPQSNEKEHKKTCWMFKKGNCRFGKKCRFVHQEDSSGTNNSQASTPESKDANFAQNQMTALSTEWSEGKSNSDEDEPAKKKKRPGLTQGLIPGKRVMAMYRKQKENSY